MLTCIICGHEDPVEIVHHINETHEGLRKYFELFPAAHVVSQAECLDSVSDEDKVLVSTYKTLAQPVRSEIIVSED